MFATGLRRGDIMQAIGDSLAACIPNHYALVREAIDRGVPLDEVKPGNKISVALQKLILPQTSAKAAKDAAGATRKFKLLWARS
jgi:pilus assembly protein CpaE